MMHLIGEVRGVHTRKAGEYSFTYLVIEDENLESHQVQLGREQENQLFQDGLNKLTGKVVAVPFYIRKYQTKNGASNVSFNYAGEQLPLEHGKLKAAS